MSVWLGLALGLAVVVVGGVVAAAIHAERAVRDTARPIEQDLEKWREQERKP